MLVFDYFFYLIREYRVLTCLALALTWVILAFAYGSLAAERKTARSTLRGLLKALPLLLLGVLVLGRPLSRAYVLRRGVAGTGTVVSWQPTFATVNKRRVMAHKTLLKLADGRLHETTFDDQSGNIYGANEGWNHLPPVPSVGQRFAVRYLPALPDNFIIMANDVRSEFGQQVQSQPLRQRYAEALQAYEFDKNSPELKAKLGASLDALLASPSVPEPEKEQYRTLRQRLEPQRP